MAPVSSSLHATLSDYLFAHNLMHRFALEQLAPFNLVDPTISVDNLAIYVTRSGRCLEILFPTIFECVLGEGDLFSVKEQLHHKSFPYTLKQHIFPGDRQTTISLEIDCGLSSSLPQVHFVDFDADFLTLNINGQLEVRSSIVSFSESRPASVLHAWFSLPGPARESRDAITACITQVLKARRGCLSRFRFPSQGKGVYVSAKSSLAGGNSLLSVP